MGFCNRGGQRLDTAHDLIREFKGDPGVESSSAVEGAEAAHKRHGDLKSDGAGGIVRWEQASLFEKEVLQPLWYVESHQTRKATVCNEGPTKIRRGPIPAPRRVEGSYAELFA